MTPEARAHFIESLLDATARAAQAVDRFGDLRTLDNYTVGTYAPITVAPSWAETKAVIWISTEQGYSPLSPYDFDKATAIGRELERQFPAWAFIVESINCGLWGVYVEAN